MRKQIAAANWKMNLNLNEAQNLVNELIIQTYELKNDNLVLIAVPFPYLIEVQKLLQDKTHFFVCAQNCAATTNGAYTGEVSAKMLNELNIKYVILGHSERRTFYHEDNNTLAQKVNLALEYNVAPVFCCGEALQTREDGIQNQFVENQLKESLFHLSAEQFSKIIIAYEPIWAIGTGKTASNEQAQEMHKHIRNVIEIKYGADISESTSILYGGSAKASNAKEIFSKPDVDGGLVGGASLIADEFISIINSLK
jgi:triosephosphate isomerase